MQQLENTTPHFVQCIVPNSNKLPGVFENNLVLRQLRCYGVLEILRVSKSSYPTRMTHQQFAERWSSFLLPQQTMILKSLCSQGALYINFCSDMVFFFWSMFHLRKHLVLQLPFYRSSIFFLKRIKSVTQSCSSAQDR